MKSKLSSIKSDNFMTIHDVDKSFFFRLFNRPTEVDTSVTGLVGVCHSFCLQISAFILQSAVNAFKCKTHCKWLHISEAFVASYYKVSVVPRQL